MYIIFKMYYIGLALVKMLSNEWNEKWKRQKRHFVCIMDHV